MRHFGSCSAQDTLRARVQGNLAHSTCLAGARADGTDAGTEDNVREAMRGAWAVEGVCGMVDTHWGAVFRNHVGSLERGFGSTCSRHPLPVAVRKGRGQCLRARHC
jgi:hypothetical protein